MSKVPANVTKTDASPAAWKACVRARRTNGVTAAALNEAGRDEAPGSGGGPVGFGRDIPGRDSGCQPDLIP